MAEDEHDIENRTIQDSRVIAKALKKVTLHQCNDGPCAATARTGESCEGMEQTGREEQGWD